MPAVRQPAGDARPTNMVPVVVASPTGEVGQVGELERRRAGGERCSQRRGHRRRPVPPRIGHSVGGEQEQVLRAGW